MERIQRALEIARLQRSAAAEISRSSTSGEHRAPPPVVSKLQLDPALLRSHRVVLPDDAGPAAHAYRMLRTQVLQRARQHGVRTIGVVSPADGEGKTLTAVNLALSLAAEPNQSVMLVDLDLRHPSVAGLLGLNAPRGLDCWFAGQCTDAAELCYGIAGMDRLLVAPTLNTVRGSSEALASSRTQELFAGWKSLQQERLQILDLPPVLLSDDVLSIGRLLDAVLVVASERRTRREDLARVRELLSSVRLLGTVLNLASESERRAY